MSKIQLMKDMRYKIGSEVEFNRFRTDLDPSTLFLDNQESFLSDLLKGEKGTVVKVFPENLEFNEHACYIVRFQSLKKSIQLKVPENLREYYQEDFLEIELLDLELL